MKVDWVYTIRIFKCNRGLTFCQQQLNIAMKGLTFCQQQLNIAMKARDYI